MSLPTLLARLPPATRDFLEGAALAKRAVYVPLLDAPESDELHKLEVYTPEEPIPLVVLAQPMGPKTEAGYPLALAMYDPADFRAKEAEAAKGKRPTVSWGVPVEELSPEDLEEAPPSLRSPKGLAGRSLADGKLVIESLVGTGAAGVVYRARHRDLHIPVAVKVMHEVLQRDPAFTKRFHAEALLASRLDHPNLTRVLDFGQEDDGLLYLAMEFLEGTSLRDILHEEGKMPLARAAGLVSQVCAGLTHAHARGVFHGDIKPENLVLVRGLDEDGKVTDVVKICDFGIAHRPAVDVRVGPIGTADYMAPELFRGEAPDAQTDVYACGVLLYELLTGDVPIASSGDDLEAIAHQIATTAPEPPSRRAAGIDARIDRVVLKALGKDKALRQLGTKGLRRELEAAMDDQQLLVAGGWKAIPETPAAPAVATAKTNDGPDWIERGPLQSMVPTMGSMAPPVEINVAPPPRLPSLHASLRPPTIRPGEGIAKPSIAPPPTDPIVRGLLATQDPVKFAAGAAQLVGVVRDLLAAADSTGLWPLRAALAEVASEKGPRAKHAEAALAPLVDAQLLGPVAEKALDGLLDRDSTASRLVARAGKSGAYALYTARLKHGTFEARERFVRILGEMDAGARAMMHVALERLESRLDHPGAAPLAEDLLKAIPSGSDVELARVVARYARLSNIALALLATAALPRIGGTEVKPQLLDLVDHKTESVATAAIKALRELSLVDNDALDALEPIAVGDLTTRLEPRIAALEALAKPTVKAKERAKAVLERVIHQTKGATPHAEDVLVVAATSFLTLGGDETIVAEKWRGTTAFLRSRLEAVIRSHGSRS